MIPKERGNTAPPAPWMTRPTSITGRVVASALTNDPTERATRTATMIALLAEHVADPAQDRRGDGRAEQVGGQEPARRALRRVQCVLQLGNGRDDQALQQAEGQRSRSENPKGDGVIRVIADHGSVDPKTELLVPVTLAKRNAPFQNHRADDERRSYRCSLDLGCPKI